MATKIGVLSDTHGDLDNRIFDYFSECDEVWHAGDIGSQEVLDQLSSFKPLRIVYGNIDDAQIRSQTKETLRFKVEEVDVLMTHIAGKPGNYAKPAYEALKKQNPPKLFVCGHSHILLVKMDRQFNMLWVNPGACGYKGFHKVRTILRFTINEDRIENMEVIELGGR
jgi:putative phosphoesterase